MYSMFVLVSSTWTPVRPRVARLGQARLVLGGPPAEPLRRYAQALAALGFKRPVSSGPSLVSSHRAKKVPRGFEPRSLDSESRVLTVTPRDQLIRSLEKLPRQNTTLFFFQPSSLHFTPSTHGACLLSEHSCAETALCEKKLPQGVRCSF